MRDTLVFDNLVQASAFHAVVAPAISDIQLWLEEGVSGYGPETATTRDIAISRITRAFSKAAALKHESRKIAQRIMSEQRIRLEHFLLSVQSAFPADAGHYGHHDFTHRPQAGVFLRRELEAQTELRHTEKRCRRPKSFSARWSPPYPVSNPPLTGTN